MTVQEAKGRLVALWAEIQQLEMFLVNHEIPTNIPSLRRYLEANPRVEQTHFDSCFGTRIMSFYGNNVMTGTFQFNVEDQKGRVSDLSFAVADSYQFSEDGFVVKYRSGTVSYKYLKKENGYV